LEEPLVYILEVVTPIGVEVVTPSCVPLFWSFGADQCASSEGFLVSLTPGTTEDSTFPLDFSSGHSIIESPDNGEVRGSLFVDPARLKDGFPSIILPSWRGQETDRSFLSAGTRLTNDLEGSNWRCVMNPGSQGILVASNPTDEGRIGTGRNPQNQKEQEVVPLLSKGRQPKVAPEGTFLSKGARSMLSLWGRILKRIPNKQTKYSFKSKRKLENLGY